MRNFEITRRVLIKSLLAASVTACARDDLPPTSKPSLNEAALRNLDAYFEQQVAIGHRAGYVLALARRGGPIHFAAIGMADIEASEPMRVDTGFRIASMSKAITSVAAMMLVDRGALSGNQPVSDFVPEFKDTPVFASVDEEGQMQTERQERPMTVAHLMSHTSGLDGFTRFTNPAAAAQGGAILESLSSSGGLAEQAARFAASPLAFQPGTGWGYGASTDVLGRVVEVAAGVPLQDFVRTELTEPLAMSGTGFIGLDKSVDGLARYYKATEDGLKAIPHASDNIQWAAGGMSMASTAPDYMRFLRMLANNGRHAGEQLLSRAAVAKLTTNVLPPELMPINVGTPVSPGAGHSWGFGVVVDSPASPPPHRVGDFRWGGSTGTAYFVSPDADLIGVILAQYSPPPEPTAESMADFESTKDDFSRMAFAAV